MMVYGLDFEWLIFIYWDVVIYFFFFIIVILFCFVVYLIKDGEGKEYEFYVFVEVKGLKG